MQGISPPATDIPSSAEFHALAQLSPVSGAESVAFIVLTFSVMGGILFSSSLHPLLGGVGALLAIVSGSCVAERVTRPLVLCALGRHVYKTLVNIGGQRTANEVARICGEDGAPTPEQVEALLGRAPQGQTPGSGGRV